MTIESPITASPNGESPRLSVTRATGEHAQAIARLHVRALSELLDAQGVPAEAPVRTDLDTLVLHQWEHSLNAREPEGHAFIALHGQEIVGFLACVDAQEVLNITGGGQILAGVEIQTLTVDPHFRRSGHASRLLAALIDTLHPTSVRAWVGSEDADLIRLYQGAGFAPSGRRRQLDMGETQGAPVRVEHLWWTRTDHSQD